jgi:hypothetical protein
LNTILNADSKITAVGKGFIKRTSSSINSKAKTFSESDIGKNIKAEAMSRIKSRRRSR